MNETKLKDAIWRAWFAPLGGLAPSSEADGADDPLSEIENAIDALVNDLERVRSALHDLAA